MIFMKDLSDYIKGYSHIPIITGPTASGKSGLALEICEVTGGELISCDSMQIYKTLDIGTAKDSADERRRVPHHMTDIIEPGCDYSVKDYTDDALLAIRDVLERGKLPVLCGGTGQFVSALYYGLEYGETLIPEAVMDRLDNELKTCGAEAMHARLSLIDPEAASKIHPNNTRRLIRALAVYEATGKTFTEKNVESRRKGAEYPFKVFFIDIDRSLLYDRINKRVDIMFEQGLEQEARMLYSSIIPRDSTCFQAIGYKEFKDYFDDECSIEEVADKIKLNSRHYAKRQITWFRGMEDIVRIPFGTTAQDVVGQISI